MKKFLTENEKFVQFGEVVMTSFDSQILKMQFWQDLMIVFTELSVYICLPKIFDEKSGIRIKIASRILNEECDQVKFLY